jgi:flagellin-like hook-associated protein FlgL
LTGATTAQDAIDLINNDTYVSTLFSAEATDGDATGNLAASIAVALSATTPTLEGGQTDAGTLIINLATDADGNVTTTADDLVEYFGSATANTALAALGISVSNVNGSDGSGLVSSGEYEFGTNGLTFTDANASGTTRARSGDTGRLTVTANTVGAAFDGVTVAFTDTVTATNETFAYDEVTKTLTIGIESGTTTVQNILDSFDGYGLEGLFTLSAGGSAATGVVYDTDSGVLEGGVAQSGDVEGAAILGNLDEGDATGESTLTFKASTHGSDAFVSIKALSGSFLTTAASGATSERSTGTDVNARINGIQAIGNGLRAVLNTSSLDLSFAVDASVASGTSFNFNITGGGALFQLGPDVVSNQQARLGIQSVSTSTLGGVSGRLFELRSGGDKALATNAGGAARVVDEVISSVTGLRGRLGAFQKTTLETNIFTLNDTLANLTEAESSIRDADFAAESALLTRAQILVQSGTSVLGIANSNPQNVLALLR